MGKRGAEWNRCWGAVGGGLYVRVDGQTLAEMTVGMARMGTSLNSVNANIYGTLNLGACALYCRFNRRVTVTRQ
jgi:hypothetical protein